MSRKILCYYCPRCRKASRDARCCKYMCHVYTSKGTVEPNLGYHPKGGIKAMGDDKYYCVECEKGMDTCRCPVHESINRRLLHGYYYSASTVSHLTSNKIRTAIDRDEAITKCREFVSKDTVAPVPLQTGIIRICPVCKIVVGTRKHCERYTKVVNGNVLVPVPTDFPLYYARDVEYGGKYYCSACGAKGENYICECGRHVSYRWFATANHKAYAFIPDLRDFETTVKIVDT